VLAFLRFAPPWHALARSVAQLVAAHATPVGSGTVARTERIPIEQRAEAAVIAWMRHQTTAYDDMRIARVAGARRDVRRELAQLSRAVIDLHRMSAPHAARGCSLCAAVARALETTSHVAAGEPLRAAVDTSPRASEPPQAAIDASSRASEPPRADRDSAFRASTRDLDDDAYLDALDI
jgi:hypothetical protein